MSTIAIKLTSLAALAAAAAPAPTPANPGLRDLFNSPMLPIIVILMIMMFWFSGSKRKQEKKRQAELNTIKRGDRIQTIGGILGTVVDVRDSEVVVKVDESNNTKLKFARNAIHRIVREEEKADAKGKGGE